MPTLCYLPASARRIEFAVLVGSLRSLLLALFSLLATGLPAPSAAQIFDTAPALDFDTALRGAESRSHELRANDAAYQSASELVVSSMQLPDPLMRFSIDNLPIDGPMRFSLDEDFMTMRSIGLTQTFPSKVKRRARSSRAMSEASVAQATRTMALTELRQQTARAWLDRYYQQQLVALLDQRRVEVLAQIEAADVAFRTGLGTQSELLNARIMLARVDDLLLDEESRLTNAITSLVRWVGPTGNAPLGVAPLITHLQSAANTFSDAIDHHPDVAVLSRQESVALADVELARLEKRVDWTATLMYGRRGPTFSDMITVGVSIPIQWNRKNRQDRELSAKIADAQQARAVREEMIRVRRAEVERRVSSWQNNLKRLEHFDSSLIPLAMERHEATLVEYRGGGSSLSALLESRRAIIDVRIERLRLAWTTATIWAELEFLYPLDADPTRVDSDTRGSVSFPETFR